MSWSDLLANPIKTITAPFDKRDGKPWAQSTARNFGHAAFGDKVGNAVDSTFLGDNKQANISPTPMPAQLAQTTPMPQSADTQNLQAWLKLLAQGKTQ